MKNIQMTSIMGVIIGAIMTFIGGKGMIECFSNNNFDSVAFAIICFVVGIVAWIIVGISDKKYDELKSKGAKIKGRSR